MTGPDDYGDDVCDPDLPTRIGEVEASLDDLHDKFDELLAALCDRDNKSQQSTKPNERN